MSSNPGAGPPAGTLLPEVNGRGGGRQGGRGPAPGSAWVKFRATEVLGGQAVGIFCASPREHKTRSVQDQETQAEVVEAQARRCGDLVWEPELVPPPDFVVVNDEADAGGACRAELCLFIRRPTDKSLKDVRMRGPRRHTVQEARKDGNDLRRLAFRVAGRESALADVAQRIRDLDVLDWRAEDLTPEDTAESSERRLPEFTTASLQDKMREQASEPQTLKEWIYEKREEIKEEYAPRGPSWSRAGQVTATPRLPGIWYVHTRQKEDGKHVSWLFFNANTGKYYRALGDGSTWIQTGVPHQPVQLPLRVLHSSVCTPNSGGRKDTLAVALSELAKTGAVLKFPLPFLDKPAALYLLVDGSRESNLAAEFCAKRFHTFFLPRLSARFTDLEVEELQSIVSEVVESLDGALLDSAARYSGCSLALAVLLGRRLLVSSLGDCRVVLCQPSSDATASVAGRSGSTGDCMVWRARTVVGANELPRVVAEATSRRLANAGAPLDLEAGGALSASSATAQMLAGLACERERATKRVARAAHAFAVLGLRPADLAQGGVTAVRTSVEKFEALQEGAVTADANSAAVASSVTAPAVARIREAGSAVEKMLGVDPFATQLLAELFYVMDDEGGIPSQQRAAAALGVEPGCGEAAAQAAIDRRYQALILQLSAAAPDIVDQAMGTIAEMAEVAARKERFWAPEERSVSSLRGLGCRDLKRPRRLMGLEVDTQVLDLDLSTPVCLVLASASLRVVSDERIAEVALLHQGCPRAACQRLLADAAAAAASGGMASSRGAGVVCAYLSDVSDDAAAAGSGAAGENDASSLRAAEAKRRKVESTTHVQRASAKPLAKRRLAQVLLKFQGSSAPDAQARRASPAGRTQQDAELKLLEIAEALKQNKDTKTLGSRFAAAAREHSDCKTATNMPHADLGWHVPGQFGKEFDAAIADLNPGCLSDLFVTPRGAHLIYRLA
eukprot:TRINITY_DN10378_c0_g1_i1.p1 TRINITY_DN10378_c0_g1~~TRINITY_DN10378_c0_g1_i1.p1  ORF type:complete len:960 (+),score=206.05 TRINITY_DN10378_c0_g1_i1:129-3008(+)